MRRDGTAYDLKSITSSYGVGMHGCRWNWSSSPYWWCDCRVNSEVYWAILYAHFIWAVFHLLKAKLVAKIPQEQTGTENICSKGLPKLHQGRTPTSLMSVGSKLQERIGLQRICIKNDDFIYDYVSMSSYLWSLKKGVHIKNAVSPTLFIWFGCRYPQNKVASLHLFSYRLLNFNSQSTAGHGGLVA